MRRYWQPPDPIKATSDEYRAFDALPAELRKMIRESDVDMSARKVFKAWMNDEWDTAKTLKRMKTWAEKQTS